MKNVVRNKSGEAITVNFSHYGAEGKIWKGSKSEEQEGSEIWHQGTYGALKHTTESSVNVNGRCSQDNYGFKEVNSRGYTEGDAFTISVTKTKNICKQIVDWLVRSHNVYHKYYADRSNVGK